MSQFWEDTQSALQGSGPNMLVKRPKLTEALLKRPPFRFLHDVISEIMRNTGYAQGLYDELESQSQNVKDKEAKVNYLTKMVEVTSLVLDQPVIARPLKIVAGLEPENTNLFLQMVAEAATCGKSSDAAVKQVLDKAGSKKQSESRAPSSEKNVEESNEKNSTPALADTSTKKQVSGSANDSSKKTQGLLETDKAASSQSPVDQASAEEEKLKSGKSQKESSQDTDSKPSEKSVQPKQENLPTDGGPQPTQSPANESTNQPDAFPQAAPASQGHDSGDKGKPKPGSKDERADSSGSERTLRPQSARKGPPKAKSVTEGLQPPSLVKRVSDHSVRPVQVVQDTDAVDDDEQPVEVILDSDTVSLEVSSLSKSEEHGKLVRDILNTKKQVAEKVGLEDTEEQGPESSGIILPNRAKDSKSKNSNDYKKLQALIQSLCQNSLSMGKSLDYLSQDYDHMDKEMKFWEMERKQHAVRLKEEERKTEEALQSNHTKILNAEEEISQMHTKINSLKTQIIRNDEKIQALIQMAISRY